MSVGLGSFITNGWRAPTHAAGFVEVVPANYGTAGSRAGWRQRRTATVIAPTAGSSDARLRPFNGLIPIVWRLRVVDAAKLASIEAKSPVPLGTPVVYSPVRTAALLTGGGLPK